MVGWHVYFSNELVISFLSLLIYTIGGRVKKWTNSLNGWQLETIRSSGTASIVFVSLCIGTHLNLGQKKPEFSSKPKNANFPKKIWKKILSKFWTFLYEKLDAMGSGQKLGSVNMSSDDKDVWLAISDYSSIITQEIIGTRDSSINWGLAF